MTPFIKIYQTKLIFVIRCQERGYIWQRGRNCEYTQGRLLECTCYSILYTCTQVVVTWGGCSICNSYLYLYKLCSIIYVFYTSTKVSKIYFKKTDLFQLYFMSIFVIFSEIYSGLCAWRYFQHWKSEGETCRRDPDTSRLCVLVRGEEKRNEETSK